jgi:phosphatidylglycerol lysyltransferase
MAALLKRLTGIFRNKFFLQMILAVFMVGMAVFFLSHEQVEILKIRSQLASCNPWYVLLGLSLTLGYVLSMGGLYVHSFRTIGAKVTLKSSIKLYLKRNVVSVFLPAGGFSSLLFFTGEVEKEGISKSEIHLASTLFGFMSIFSVVVVAVPILGYSMWEHSIHAAALWGFIALLMLTALFAFFLVSMFKGTWALRILTRLKPEWADFLNDMLSRKLSRKHIFLATLYAVAIELIGVAHLYISMLALGVEPSLMASMIGYVTMVLLLMASPFLRGLGAIEVSLTYILGQYGYPVVIAASMTLLYRFFEFWLPLITGIISFVSKKDSIVLRLLPGLMMFALGLVNIVSALTPSVPERLTFLKAWLPESVLSMSNGLVLAMGLYLLILFVFLLQGSRRAWFAGVVLSLLSIAGHLLKGVDYEEALLALLAVGALWRTRAYYRRKAHKELTRLSFQVLFGSLLAILIFGVLAFLFMNTRHFHTDFDLLTSIKTMLRVFFLFDDAGLHPYTAFARHFLYALHIAGALVLGFIVFSLLKPIFAKPYNTSEEKELATRILQKYGSSASDYFKIYPDKYFYIADDKDGFISFKVTGGYAIVLGNPVCRDEDAARTLILSFDNYCLENGMTSVYYRIPKESLELYSKLGKRNVPVGDEGIVDLDRFSLNGLHMIGVRKMIRNLQEQGFSTRVHVPPIDGDLFEKLIWVSDSWKQAAKVKNTKQATDKSEIEVLKKHIIITVEDSEGHIYAFLNIIPDDVSGDAANDAIRKVADAPEGVMEMLLVRTMIYLKEQGFRSVNLGLAPLSGIQGTSFTERTARFAYEKLKAYKNLKHLRLFKEKFSSRWEQRFLVYNNNYHLPSIVNVLKRLSKGR